MIYLKEITENSWFVADTEMSENVGILSRKPDKSFYIIFGDQKSNFKNEDELKNFFQFDIMDTIVSRITENDKRNFVAGFPVDLPSIYTVDDDDDIESDLPIYKKTEKSKAIHCAGYYCIHYENGWLDSYCPKIETLTKYGYEGPFKTKIQMRTHLAQLRRK